MRHVNCSGLVRHIFAPGPRRYEFTMIPPRMWSEGEFSVEELNRMVEGLKLIGEIKADVDWSTVLDKSYLPADLQAKQ